MEQLDGTQLKALLEKARKERDGQDKAAFTSNARQPLAPERTSPWDTSRPLPPGTAQLPVDPPDNEGPTAPADAGSSCTMPLQGIERRLVRRARAAWQKHCPEGTVPDLLQAASLLAPPFIDNLILVSFRSPPADDLADILYVGEALATLGRLAAGPVLPERVSDAPLSARLAFLAKEAVDARAPIDLDSENSLGAPLVQPLLIRAIALPVRLPQDRPGAIIVVSWRKLLSQDETAALHRELAAAIDWIARNQT